MVLEVVLECVRGGFQNPLFCTSSGSSGTWRVETYQPGVFFFFHFFMLASTLVMEALV